MPNRLSRYLAAVTPPRDVRGRLRHLRNLAWRLAEPPRLLPPVVVQSLKVAVASGLAWGLGQALHSPRPFAAVLAVIILMQGHAYGSLLNAFEFLLGVVAGLVLGILASRFLGVSPLVLAAIIFACMLMGGWLKVSAAGLNNQIAISALLVLASGSSENLDRLWETALGGAVGVVVSALIWPPNPVRELRDRFHEAKERLKEDVLRTLELVGADGDAEAHRRRVRSNSERVDEAIARIGPAEDALRWNPWHVGRRHDLSGLEDRLRLISHLYRTVRTLARQAGEAPRPERGQEHDWTPSLPHLRAVGAATVEAIERRLSGQDPGDAVNRARAALSRFTEAAPRDPHAVALAVALDNLLSDVEGWRPPGRVRRQRRLVERVVGAGRQIQERGRPAIPRRMQEDRKS